MRPPFVLAVLALATAAHAGPDLLVGSWQTHSVRRYDTANGQYLGDFIPPFAGGLNLPDGLAWGADTRLYVASSNSNRVLRFSASGAFVDAFITTGLSAPGNLQFGPDGRLYVCNKNTHQVLCFDQATGGLLRVAAQGGGMLRPVGLAWDAGVLYVAGFQSGGVFRYDATTGAFLGVLTMDVVTPLILRVGPANDLFVTSHNQDSVRRYDLVTGALLGIIGGGGIDCPVGHLVAPDGSLIVASWQNHLLLRYDNVTGAFLNVFASGNGLFLPNDLLLMPEACYPDCNGDGALNLADFGCFQTKFALADPYADCNGDGALNLADFGCFQTLFALGCP